MKIYEDFFNKDVSCPCRSCENYGDGEVYENGEDFHEFTCYGGRCLHCAENDHFDCFEPKEDDKQHWILN